MTAVIITRPIVGQAPFKFEAADKQVFAAGYFTIVINRTQFFITVTTDALIATGKKAL